MTITASGVYDLTLRQYLGQPTDTLCMGASDAKILNENTPAHVKAAWAEPDYGTREMNMGSYIHALILEPHRAAGIVSVVKADSWRTDAARKLRDDALNADKLPILEKDVALCHAAADAVNKHPLCAQLLNDGEGERSWFAKDPATGLYRKARPDWFTKGRIVIDVKTCGSLAPEQLQRRVFDGGWFMQAPWYLDVVEQVDGKPAAGYCWICVEQEAPHAVVVRKPSGATLMHGHRLNQQAFKIFAACAAADRWPSYPAEIEELALPDFAFYRLEESALKSEARGMEAVRWSRELGAPTFG